MSEQYEGRCMCGGIRFIARGKPKWVLWCHCESCRRHSGAPVSVFVSFADDAVTQISGEITRYESSPGTVRGFCSRCGSTLTCSNQKLPNETHFHIGAFERPAELVPTGELFRRERLSWFAPRRGALGGVRAIAAVGLNRSRPKDAR
jgi:hypothetical protein